MKTKEQVYEEIEKAMQMLHDANQDENGEIIYKDIPVLALAQTADKGMTRVLQGNELGLMKLGINSDDDTIRIFKKVVGFLNA